MSKGFRPSMLRRTVLFAVAVLAFSPFAAAAERQVPASAGEMQLSFAPVVKRVSPAVVNVYASRTVQQQVSPFFSDPFFRQFFGGAFGGQPSTRVQRSLGSGVIIGAEGLIVTNFHVIAQADEVKVALSDKREFAADIVLKDQRSDLAVLKIQGSPGNLPVIQFADSDQVQVGDLVLAVGDPFGVGQTVTSGIVSAFARVPGDANEDQYFIQTDAAINPGNSGGALVDMEGRLIGINRMIVSPSGASSGIGFAIPSNLVRTVTTAAATGEAPHRPWLGADLQSVTPELAASLNLETPNGVLVAAVASDGPASTAGIKVGDLVTSIDGEAVDDLGSLTYRLATRPIGGQAKLGVVRSGKLYTATVALEAAPEKPARDKRTIDGDTAFSGATILNLSPAVAEELGIGGASAGVVISDVPDGSPAAAAGFARGDIIAQVNGTNIDSTKTLVDILTEKRRYFDLVVKRGGQAMRLRMAG
jgi:Do/DeqQ family serine protease